MAVLIFSEMYDIIYKEAQPKVTAGLHTFRLKCLSALPPKYCRLGGYFFTLSDLLKR